MFKSDVTSTAQRTRVSAQKFAGLRQRLRLGNCLLHGNGVGESTLPRGGIELQIDDFAGHCSAHRCGVWKPACRCVDL